MWVSKSQFIKRCAITTPSGLLWHILLSGNSELSHRENIDPMNLGLCHCSLTVITAVFAAGILVMKPTLRVPGLSASKSLTGLLSQM